VLAEAALPVPASLMTLLAGLAPLFTAPPSRTFCGLACGFPAQPGKRTVRHAGRGGPGPLPEPRPGAPVLLPRPVEPGRAGPGRGEAGRGAASARREPAAVAIDDTLSRRRGKKVRAASWFHDGSAQAPAKTGYGNNWVIAAVAVRLPAISRPVAIAVLATLVIKDTCSASRLRLARRMAQMLAGALPGRGIHVAAGSAYAGGEPKKLPRRVTWTTRLRKDAALHELPPGRTGRRGRPREKGDRLPSLAKLSATVVFEQVTVTRHGKTASIQAASVTCLRHPVFGTRPVTVVLIRDRTKTGYDPAPVTTDTAASPAQGIERYAARWSAEVAIEDSKQIFGAGQARNRTARAAERAIPSQLACQAITVTWHATAGHHLADVEHHRARAPWHRAKARPSTADMAAKLRPVLIAAKFQASRPDQPAPEEINVIRLAWEDLAA
jgi:hypothetical protein